MGYSLLNFNTFLPIGRQVSWICSKIFEKQQVAPCRFSKGFRANQRNMSTNMTSGLTLTVMRDGNHNKGSTISPQEVHGVHTNKNSREAPFWTAFLF
jgi:hypothetical protein